MLAIAVLGVASALIVTAPTVVTNAAVASNQGLSLIGAASVPPAFIAPHKHAGR